MNIKQIRIVLAIGIMIGIGIGIIPWHASATFTRTSDFHMDNALGWRGRGPFRLQLSEPNSFHNRLWGSGFLGQQLCFDKHHSVFSAQGPNDGSLVYTTAAYVPPNSDVGVNTFVYDVFDPRGDRSHQLRFKHLSTHGFVENINGTFRQLAFAVYDMSVPRKIVTFADDPTPSNDVFRFKNADTAQEMFSVHLHVGEKHSGHGSRFVMIKPVGGANIVLNVPLVVAVVSQAVFSWEQHAKNDVCNAAYVPAQVVSSVLIATCVMALCTTFVTTFEVCEHGVGVDVDVVVDPHGSRTNTVGLTGRTLRGAHGVCIGTPAISLGVVDARHASVILINEKVIVDPDKILYVSGESRVDESVGVGGFVAVIIDIQGTEQNAVYTCRVFSVRNTRTIESVRVSNVAAKWPGDDTHFKVFDVVEMRVASGGMIPTEMKMQISEPAQMGGDVPNLAGPGFTLRSMGDDSHGSMTFKIQHINQ